MHARVHACMHICMCASGEARELWESVLSFQDFQPGQQASLPTYTISLGPHFSSEGPRLQGPRVFSHWGSDKESAARDCCTLCCHCALWMNTFLRMPYVSYMYKCAYTHATCIHCSILAGVGNQDIAWFCSTLLLLQKNQTHDENSTWNISKKNHFSRHEVECYRPVFLSVEQRYAFTSVSHGTLIHTRGVSILPHCFASPTTFSCLNYFLWGWIF